jgi:hypothetical protein
LRKSIGDYPENWPEISRKIKDDANWKCVRCNEPHDPENGYCLTVHHLDLNPANCEWWNCPALCQRCHLQIQAKVVMKQVWMFEHSEWFKPYVAGYYVSLKGLPTDKEYILKHIDEILELAKYEALA